MRRTGLAVAVAITAPLLAQAQGQAELNHRIDLILEKKEGSQVRIVDPTYVFSDGDKLRFRLKSAVKGFLYVMDQGSSGSWQQLFPRDELTQSREVIAGKDYIVPASGSGWFAVTGPAGYDNIYFLVSPIDLGRKLPGASAPHESSEADAAALASATPRCNDEMFRMKGECLDTNAGLKPMDKGEVLPDRLPQVQTVTSRDLIIVGSEKDTSISSTQPFDAPAVYRFRIAHK